ncbi:unnamed protein product [Microthlaspi erraticum]|uniref:Reverse transcriptase Ty1/copia-type domain-containing protein n=1 Tax=Microthlaspi erraticum TaxID=1685480 RepID=A0A6D2JML4_9BRAS|nr:unnamed protein product [Microthlaspi erraticum]
MSNQKTLEWVKHILRYLQGTKDMGLFFSNTCKEDLIGFADAGYLSDPHTARSQTGYVFTCGGTAISWRSMKQTLAATSSNHAEILAIHEASRECIWLRSVVNTFEKIVVYRQEKELQRLCMKIMLLASHNSRMGTLKETERSTSYRSFSSPMSYRRMAM